MRLEGKSMLPFLRSGTLMTVRNCDIMDIHIGDIVIFKKDGITIAHRVLERIKSDGRFFLRTKSGILCICSSPSESVSKFLIFLVAS